MPRIRIGQQNVPLPANRFARLAIGLLLIIGGILGFLPVLGFWMVPLGLLVLSYDLPRFAAGAGGSWSTIPSGFAGAIRTWPKSWGLGGEIRQRRNEWSRQPFDRQV